MRKKNAWVKKRMTRLTERVTEKVAMVPETQFPHGRQVGPEHPVTHNGGGELWAIKLESYILNIISNFFLF